KLDLTEITRTGGAGYYMSFIFTRVGLPELSRKMLELEWQDGQGIWQAEAGLRLLQELLNKKEYSKVDLLGTEFINKFPSRRAGVLNLIEAKFKLKQDEEVLWLMERLRRLEELQGDEKSDDVNLLFIRVVSSSRLGKADWEKDLVTLFSNFPASDIHEKAYQFLLERGDFSKVFTKDEISVFYGKYLLALEKYREALSVLEPLLETPGSLLFTESNLRDLVKAYQYSGSAYIGAAKMKALLPGLVKRIQALPGENESIFGSLFFVFEAAGRLYRSAGWYSHAAQIYEEALQYAALDHQYDRALWYHLDSLYRVSPESMLKTLEKYVKLWHDPAYFTDLIDTLCTYLVDKRRWESIYRLYTLLDGYADKVNIARSAFISSRAIHTGLLKVKDERSDLEKKLLERIISLDSDLYYTLLTSAILKRKPSLFYQILEKNGVPASPVSEGALPSEKVVLPRESASIKAKSVPHHTDFAQESLVMGFITFGLYLEAYRSAREREAALGDDFITLIAGLLYEAGYRYESIMLMKIKISRNLSASIQPEDLAMIYPLAFKEQIERLAQTENLPKPLLYALVREESYFNSSIVSKAGAVGLTQLMPATAREVAQKMGFKNPDLNDPDTNLAIGVHYLGRLFSRFNHPTHALLAYNAGPARTAGWINTNSDLPDELFLEAIPFLETRNYGRKILVSAAVYGYLYEKAGLVNMVKMIFPGISL
ncbi:MAG: lytic transglycosylase domain-containing protein, partial [Spirochaetota bacterium]